ncbi:hypothetical protein GJ496_000260 [Pomphorhynchus laevis]|nr:hypothetical protein GJ496_006917 [Pomphorhynchus laevis]KAI0990147.1 hypothetical protein GJ496_000260 [Pomphorhynchus laevis]
MFAQFAFYQFLKLKAKKTWVDRSAEDFILKGEDRMDYICRFMLYNSKQNQFWPTVKIIKCNWRYYYLTSEYTIIDI